ncbi:transcription elongation factor B polypeptide 3 [Uranotaenia lowii]|uniref:transcription elongation factor B polypeptide 3 n=1 Tax=Uranotaenia lowii TaxID=190385 RepID=UPI002478765D|nr:transcription elongation factor B polypeptide 3 [Uranotaenia lowii]
MTPIGEIITHYQKSIDRSLDNEQRLLHCINKLYRLPILVQHLQETGIGRTVNGLRRHDGEVGVAAKALVTKWKRMVAAEEDDDGQNGEEEPEEDDEDRGHQDRSAGRGDDQSAFSSRDDRDQDMSENYLEQDDGYDEKPLQVDEQLYDDEVPIDYEEEPAKSRDLSEQEDDDVDNDENNYEGTPNGYHPRSMEDDSERVSTSSSHRHRERRSSHDSDSRKIDTGHRSSSSRSKSKEYSHSKSKSSSSSHSSKEGGNGSSSIRSRDRDHDRKSGSSSSSKKSSSHDKDRERSGKHTSSSSSSSRKESNHSKAKESSNSQRDKDSSSKQHSSSSKSSSSKHDKESSSSSKRQLSPERSEDENVSKKIKKEESSKSSAKEKSSRVSSKTSSSKDRTKKSSDKKRESSSKKSSPKANTSDDEEEGINHSEGTSFDAVMAMMDMPSSSKKKQPGKGLEKDKSSSFSMPPPAQKIKTEKQSPSSSGKSREARSPSTASSSSGYSSSSSSSTPSLLKQKVKLEPLPDASELVESLPTISPNYRPMPLNQVVMDCVFSNNGKAQRSILTEEETLGHSMQSKNLRTKVFSGIKTFTGIVPSLYDLCIRLLQENIELLDCTGGIPFDMLKPVLERASAKQLEYLEEVNPYLLEDTDILWEQHCKRLFRSQKRKEEECESWREMYARCSKEREVKLNRLTANIKMAQVEQTAAVRRSQLAYVDASMVKPPRQVISKQIKYGTAKAPVVSPAARVASLKNVGGNITGAGDSRLKVAPGVRDNAQAHVFAPTKPKKAPLMAKVMTSIKGFKGFRR